MRRGAQGAVRLIPTSLARRVDAGSMDPDRSTLKRWAMDMGGLSRAENGKKKRANEHEPALPRRRLGGGNEMGAARQRRKINTILGDAGETKLSGQKTHP